MILPLIFIGIRLQRLVISKSSFQRISSLLAVSISDPCNIVSLEFGSSDRIADGSCESTTMSISKTTFSNYKHTSYTSLANFFGGAAYIKSKAIVTLEFNQFNTLSARTAGGAIYIEEVSSLNMNFNNFSQCSSKLGGSAVFKSSNNSVLSSNRFSGSQATSTKGGAIYFDNSCLISMSGDIFETSGARYGGSLSFFNSNKIKVDGAEFSSSASAFNGGTVSIENTNDTNFSSCTFTSSTSSDLGGAFYISESNYVKVCDSNFSISNCKSGEGGTFYIISTNKMELINNIFDDSFAFFKGGGLELKNSNNISIAGNTLINCVLNESDPNSNIKYREGGALRIENCIDINISDNCFKDCFTLNYGGAISCNGPNTEKLNFINNTFTNCHTVLTGGAMDISNTNIVSMHNNSFVECYTNSFGGAVSLSSLNNIYSFNNTYTDVYCASSGALYLTKVANPVILIGDTFNGCYSKADYSGGLCVYSSPILDIKIYNYSLQKCYTVTNYGGSLAFWTVNNVKIDGIICEDSIAKSTGGAFYFFDIKTKVQLCNMNMRNCTTTDKGGAMYLEKSQDLDIKSSKFCYCKCGDGGAVYYKSGSYFAISDSSFDNCESTTGNGGSLYLYYIYPQVSIKRNTFTICKSSASGSAIFYEYSYSINPDEINIYSEGNIFDSCVNGVSGSFYIKSKIIKNPEFVNDKYINCISKGEGGGLMCEVSDSESFRFQGCSFSGCSSLTNAGGIGLTLADSKSLIVRIYGCAFDNCSAVDGACIGIYYKSAKPPITIDLSIQNYGEINSSFKNLNGNSSYAIFAYARTVKMENVSFEDIFTGVLNTATYCRTINLIECIFSKCESKNYIVSSSDLADFTLTKATFNNCGSCYFIKSNNIEIASLTMIGTKKHPESPSSITGDSISISNIVLSKHNDILTFNINKNMSLIDGLFSSSTDGIKINGNNISPSDVYVDSLITNDALMFTVDSNIKNFTLVNSKGSYLQNLSPYTILSSSAISTTIINCSFDTGTSVPIVLYGTTSSLKNCNIKGDDSIIGLNSELTLQDNRLTSKNGPIIDIIGGIVNFVSDSNCLFSPPDNVFKNGNGKLFQDGTSIAQYQNNESNCDIEPTHQFSIQMSSDFVIDDHNDHVASSEIQVIEKIEQQSSNIVDDYHIVGNSEGNNINEEPTLSYQRTNDQTLISTTVGKIEYIQSSNNDFNQRDQFTSTENGELTKKNEIASKYLIIEQTTEKHFEKIDNNKNSVMHSNDKIEKFIPTLTNLVETPSIHVETITKLTKLPTNEIQDSTKEKQTETETSQLIHSETKYQKIPTYIKSENPSKETRKENLTPTKNDIISAFPTKSSANVPVQSDSKFEKSDQKVIETKHSLHVDRDIRLSLDNLQDEDQGSGQNKSNVGMIAGIAVAIVVVVVIIVLIVICLVVKKGRKDTDDIRETEFETDFSTTTSSSTYGTTACMTQEMPTTSWTANNPVAEEDFYRMDFEEDDKD